MPKGCTYGVIGRNGSGKSTLLKCVAGITRPTEGDVKVDGRISALIELGAGFHPEISGRENIFINGIMLGLTKKEIQRRFDEIVEFAEMQDFIDAPVKTYSSGMYMRLGFAVAIHVDPEVLLVDEVLAVGDQGFTHKCLDKFAEFRRRNKSILLVTHSLDLVEKFCDEAHWLDKGVTKGEGDPKRVVAAYVINVEDSRRERAGQGRSGARRGVGEGRRGQPTAAGDVGASFGSAESVDTGEGPHRKIAESEGRIQVRRRPVGHPRDRDHERHDQRPRRRGRPRVPERRRHPGAHGRDGQGDDHRLRVRPRPLQRRRRLRLRHQHQPRGVPADARSTASGVVTFTIDNLDLVEGTYRLDLAAHKADGYPYDYHRLLYTFRVKSRIRDVGIYRPDHAWSFGGGHQVQ